ncbi:MAG: hypothetical protein ACR2FG_03870 [Marmoricola sp.]
MISTLIALPYELARLPLLIVDNSLSDRLPETSGPRVTVDRAIGSADKLAGALLGNRDIARRGADRIERSDKLLTAARLEREAATRREQARETAAAGSREAAQKRKAAQDRAASGLDEADAAEARGKQEAKAKAVKTASAKKAAANQRAASRAATVAQRKGRVDSAAEAKKQAAQRKTKTKLDDARETKQSAVAVRADAQRLSDLTEAKKRKRKQS